MNASKATCRVAQGRACLLAAALFSVAAAHAAGGHHAVDDAAILEPGACKLEGWWTKDRGGERAVHAGGGCRVGPVELNAATEYARDGGSSQTAWGLQAKWAAELVPGVSAGLSLAPGWQAHIRPRYQGSTLAALFTWAARDDLALHLNLGRDLVHGGADQNRGGVSAEWLARPGWSLVAERYLEDGTHFVRGGARWAVTENWSVDISRAQRLHGPGASNWTLGTIWQFDRP
jgi:hypothetical protein